jgi:hypothetical protein
MAAARRRKEEDQDPRFSEEVSEGISGDRKCPVENGGSKDRVVC